MYRRIVILAAIALALAACQTSSASRKQELAQICADPSNRQSGSFYFSECEALYPLTATQLQKMYVRGAPVGSN